MKIILNVNKNPANRTSYDCDLDYGIEMLLAEMDQRESAAARGDERVTTAKFAVYVDQDEFKEREEDLKRISDRMLKQNNNMYVLVPKNNQEKSKK